MNPSRAASSVTSAMAPGRRRRARVREREHRQSPGRPPGTCAAGRSPRTASRRSATPRCARPRRPAAPRPPPAGSLTTTGRKVGRKPPSGSTAWRLRHHKEVEREAPPAGAGEHGPDRRRGLLLPLASSHTGTLHPGEHEQAEQRHHQAAGEDEAPAPCCELGARKNWSRPAATWRPAACHAARASADRARDQPRSAGRRSPWRSCGWTPPRRRRTRPGQAEDHEQHRPDEAGAGVRRSRRATRDKADASTARSSPAPPVPVGQAANTAEPRAHQDVTRTRRRRRQRQVGRPNGRTAAPARAPDRAAEES